MTTRDQVKTYLDFALRQLAAESCLARSQALARSTSVATRSTAI